MTQPNRLGSRTYNSASYASTLNTASNPIDFGSGTGRWIQVTVLSNNNGVTPDSVAIAGGGTLTADATVATPTGGAGNGRSFRLIGDGAGGVPSGVATVTATMSSGVGYIQMVVTWGDGASAISSASITSVAGASPIFDGTGATSDDLFIVNGYCSGQTVAGGNVWTAPYVTIAASEGSTLGVITNAPAAGFIHSWSLYEAAVASTIRLGLSISGYQYTPSVGGWLTKITGVAAAGPSITTQPSSQVVNEGNTATFTVSATGTGTLHYQWKRADPGSGSFTNVGTDSASYTTPVLDDVLDSGATYKCNVSDDNGNLDTAIAALTVNTVAASATVSILNWVNNTGTQHPAGTVLNISFHSISTKALIHYHANAVLDASHNYTLTSPSFTPGVTYAWFADSPVEATWFASGRVTAA